MASKNGTAPDLDLSAFSRRLTVKVTDDYAPSISAEMPLTLLSRASAAVSAAGKALQGEADVGPDMEAEIYAIAEEMLRWADPPPPLPVRELLTPMAAVTFAGFFLRNATERLTNTLSSKQPAGSPTSSTVA